MRRFTPYPNLISLQMKTFPNSVAVGCNDVVDQLVGCERIVVISGAGISTSAGLKVVIYVGMAQMQR
jgi:hypothetical protein